MIIAITGTNGSGKGTVVEYLVQKYGFKHYGFRDFFLQKMRDQGLPTDRDSIITFANKLRAENGGESIVRELLEYARTRGGNAVLESVRAPVEADFLLNQPDTYLFATDAPEKLRYERAVLRASETDKVSFEQFIQQQLKEMKSDDPNKQNISYCISKTDPRFVFQNNGTLDELHARIDSAMSIILNPST